MPGIAWGSIDGVADLQPTSAQKEINVIDCKVVLRAAVCTLCFLVNQTPTYSQEKSRSKHSPGSPGRHGCGLAAGC